MFDFDNPDAITQINTRSGDQWRVRTGTLEVHKTVVRFRAATGENVQVHVAEVCSVVSAP